MSELKQFLIRAGGGSIQLDETKSLRDLIRRARWDFNTRLILIKGVELPIPKELTDLVADAKAIEEQKYESRVLEGRARQKANNEKLRARLLLLLGNPNG